MTVRPAAGLALSVCAAIVVAATVFLVLGPERPLASNLFGGVGGAAFLLLSLAYAAVGAMIAARLPGHRIGWLFSLLGLLVALNVLTYAYAAYGVHATSGPVARVTASVQGWGQLIVPLLALSLLLFPDGRLPSRRWWPVAAMTLVSIAGFLLAALLRPGPFDDPFATVTNPLGVPGLRDAMITVNQASWALTFVAMALGVLAVFLRLRHAHGLERRQLKLVLAVAAAVGAVAVAVMATWYVWPEGGLPERIAVMGLAFTAFPVAAGIAILRYRLYDIDVVINRALVYGALTVLLGATYAAIALLLGTALGSGSVLATAVATLAVAVAFRPLRARLQNAVDRRFSSARDGAVHRVAAFLEDVRAGRAAPENVQEVLRAVLGDPGLELRFVLPGGERHVDVRGAPAVDAPGDERERTSIERAGTPLGVVLHKPATRDCPDLLRHVVDEAVLAIEIVRLRVELRHQLDEVAASRARIVATGDAERRRIERDLHDGAQQRLVSIGLALRHAQHELGPDAAPRETLDGAVAEIAIAIRELRELARGLRPAQLDAGLGPALQELAGRAALPVAVEATAERFPDVVESAAYFIACEGLTNATKHAHASRVSLSAQRQNGSLVVCVADDGVGGAAPAEGSGLSGLLDRVGAHGGTLRIESARGSGTRLIAELPCES